MPPENPKPWAQPVDTHFIDGTVAPLEQILGFEQVKAKQLGLYSTKLWDSPHMCGGVWLRKVYTQVPQICGEREGKTDDKINMCEKRMYSSSKNPYQNEIPREANIQVHVFHQIVGFSHTCVEVFDWRKVCTWAPQICGERGRQKKMSSQNLTHRISILCSYPRFFAAIWSLWLIPLAHPSGSSLWPHPSGSSL